MMSSDSVTDAPVMSSLPIVEEGSESPEMSELVDLMLEYKPPPHLTAEMGEAVDEVIKYINTTAELLRIMSPSSAEMMPSSSKRDSDSCSPCT